MHITRRDFLHTGLLATGALLSRALPAATEKTPPQAMTVRGPIAPNDMGFTLPHEHIMSIFGGPMARDAVYDEARLFEIVIPYLKKIKALGCRTLIDCTAAYFGRRADLLKHISTATGLNILTNTGYYGAAKDRYVPEHALQETAGQLAERWIHEWQDGIDKTGIRPGFIKIGVDGGPLSEIDRKLIRAAAKTHLATGLTIAAHTGNSPEAVADQLTVLKEEGVHPGAWIWVHAQNVKTPDLLQKAVEQGAWIEFDGVRESTLQKHLNLVAWMKQHDFLDQVLLSHDGNSFRYGDRPFKPYDAIFAIFIPKLKEAGFSPEEIRRLTVDNPSRAFTVRVRTRG